MSQSAGAVEWAGIGQPRTAGPEAAPVRARPPVQATPGLAPRARHTALQQALDHRRVFVLLPFAMIVGLTLHLVGWLVPDPVVISAVAVGLAAATVALRRSLLAIRLAVLGGAVWLGVALLPLHGALFGTPMLAYPAYGTYTALVDEIVSESADGRRVIVSDLVPVGEARQLPVRRARIVVDAATDVAPGDRIEAAIRFYPVPGPVVPGGFDTQFHAYFDGVGAYGAVVGPATRIAEGGGTLARIVDAVRREIATRIDRHLAGPALGIARSMMIGDQSQISDETREIMAESGLAHIYSISGLHLSIVAGGTLVVIRLLLAPFPGLGRYGSTKKLAALVAIGTAFAYLLLAGGASNVPAFRSTIMIALIFGAVLAGRRALTMRNVAIAALIVIATDPASVFRPSFQLSFAAVVALVGVYEMFRSDRESAVGLGPWVARAVAATAFTSLVAGAATLPFSAFHFQQTAPLGIAANVMSLFLIMPIMASIVGAVLAMPLGLEAAPLAVLQWGIDALLWIAALVTEWSAGLTLHPLLAPATLLFALAALAWFAFLPTWHRLIGPALVLPLVLLFGVDRPPDVLISDSTQALVVRLDGRLAAVAGRAESFAVDVWRDTYGEPIEVADIACDSIACVATSSAGFRLAVVRDPAGFSEECDADLVVTRRRAPRSCAAPLVIDEGALENGVHALRWDAGARRFEVRRAIEQRDRPWRPPF